MAFAHRWRSLALPVSPIEAIASTRDNRLVAVGREIGHVDLWDASESFSRIFVLIYYHLFLSLRNILCRLLYNRNFFGSTRWNFASTVLFPSPLPSCLCLWSIYFYFRRFSMPQSVFAVSPSFRTIMLCWPLASTGTVSLLDMLRLLCNYHSISHWFFNFQNTIHYEISQKDK